MERLETKSCEEIMTTVYKPIEFVVEELIAQGLYLLAGAPKLGKSWLSLDICLSIAKGKKVLGQEVKRGTALYLCLEDSFERIQKRLYEITDEPTDDLHFAIMSESISGGLDIQITKFKSEHQNLKIVVIDTLQKIREETESNYGSDYKELSMLKAIADKLSLTIMLVKLLSVPVIRYGDLIDLRYFSLSRHLFLQIMLFVPSSVLHIFLTSFMCFFLL